MEIIVTPGSQVSQKMKILLKLLADCPALSKHLINVSNLGSYDFTDKLKNRIMLQRKMMVDLRSSYQLPSTNTSF